MNDTDFAYLAGAMDADGYFTMKKSTYQIRVTKESKNPTYSESVGLRQVTPQVPYFLKETFGGTVAISKGYTDNSKPLYNYRATDKVASSLCNALLPYLRIKKRQVEILIELRESKDSRYKQESYWFEREFPDWQKLEMITHTEVSKMLGYHCSHTIVSVAIRNGTLLALPYIPSGTKATPRIPRLLVERLRDNSGTKKYLMPKQLLEWKERLFREIRELNKIGINGTSIYHQTGFHKPL